MAIPRKSSCRLTVSPYALLNDSIRPVQYIRRNRQADLLGSFEIDDELKLHRLFDGQVGGIRSVKDYGWTIGAAASLLHEGLRHS